MKFKNWFASQGCWFIALFLCLFVLFLFLFMFFQKEQYQQKKVNKTEDDLMDILEKFCTEQFGEEWGVDHVYRYNDKIMFATMQVQGAVIDLSVQPESRAIIIEDIKGKTSHLTKRVYRF